MKSFSLYNIPSELVKSLMERGVASPTEVQSKTIPLLLEHEGDFICRSATGTGKTFAFGIPLITKVDCSVGVVQAVIMVPTRELCEQVANELKDISKQIEGLKIEAIYGGVSVKAQVKEVSNGVQIIVATPGRLLDLIKRKVIHLSSLKYLVLDEADEMLSSGFQQDIDDILSFANKSYSSWLFSATMPDKVNKIVKKYLDNDLRKVLLGTKDSTNKGIKHLVIRIKPEIKLNVLLHYLNYYSDMKGILFCRTKSGVQKLYKQLSANGFSSGAIHGSLPQGLRTKVMDQFREGHINLLIATDVASRGVDVSDIGFVIQYHIPDTTDAYTHRSGRTSRIGNTGVSLTFVFEEEMEHLMHIEETLKLNLEYLSLPSEYDQVYSKAILIGKQIANQKPDKRLSIEEIDRFRKLLNHMSKDEILTKLVSYLLADLE